MSRKHFEAIAAVIREQVELSRKLEERQAITALRSTAFALAAEFARFNTAFNTQRFITACGF